MAVEIEPKPGIGPGPLPYHGSALPLCYVGVRDGNRSLGVAWRLAVPSSHGRESNSRSPTYEVGADANNSYSGSDGTAAIFWESQRIGRPVRTPGGNRTHVSRLRVSSYNHSATGARKYAVVRVVCFRFIP
jgi:hypothetical protein